MVLKPDPMPVQFATMDGQTFFAVHFSNKGIYGNAVKGVGSGGKGGVSGGKTKFDPLSIAECINCDGKDHVMRDCKRPIDYVKAAHQKRSWSMKRAGNPTAAAVLYDMAHQMNGPGDERGGTEMEGATEDVSEQLYFEALMASSGSTVGGTTIEPGTLVITTPGPSEVGSDFRAGAWLVGRPRVLYGLPRLGQSTLPPCSACSSVNQERRSSSEPAWTPERPAPLPDAVKHGPTLGWPTCPSR